MEEAIRIRSVLFVGVCLSFFFPVSGQIADELRRAEVERYRAWATTEEHPLQKKVDATYYLLDLNITLEPENLHGTVEGRYQSLVNGLDSLVIDFADNFTILSVNGPVQNYTRSNDRLFIKLSQSLNAGEQAIITIEYEGVPVTGTFLGFDFTIHGSTLNNTDAPAISTISAAFGARTWWPCKDFPYDKPDSVDVWVTVPDTAFRGFDFYAVSNGKLRADIRNGDGTRTFKWHEGYPIATYLVSLAVTNYQIYDDWYIAQNGDSLHLPFYVYPERIDDAFANYDSTADMIATYAGLFGEYPFMGEKYGMANYTWGGAMENQTVSSMGSMDFWTVAHELSHMWFGDMISPIDWHHSWINEGFANYCEALYAERLDGPNAYRSYMQTMEYKQPGSIYLYDLSGNIFPTIIYWKGAWVLHMLRHVLGDSTFFQAMKEYATDPQLKYGNSSTEIFKQRCEQVSGMDLAYFFQQWIYGSGYPQYQYNWNRVELDSTWQLNLTIHQVQPPETNEAVFTMPVDVVVLMTPGPVRDTLTVFNDQRQQNFQFEMPLRPLSVNLDPAKWILRDATRVTALDDLPAVTPRRFSLAQNYPNPFNPQTLIDYEVAETSTVQIAVFNVLGQKVETLIDMPHKPGTYQQVWDAGDVASGVYLISMNWGNGYRHRLIKKAVLMK